MADAPASNAHQDSVVLPVATPVHRLTRGGIRTLWVPYAGDVRVALAFRVGLVDEPYVHTGLTHLVEHLAMSRLDEPAYAINGLVAHDQTSFTARGTVQEAVAFLEHVASALRELPIGRLAIEREILTAEAGPQAGLATVPYLAHVRWGRAAPGRLGLEELALRSADARLVQDWANARFTAEAATLCWVGPEPPPLQLALPAGPPAPLPPVPAPQVPLPFFVPGDDDVVGLAVTVPAGIAAAIFAEVLERRLLQILRHERGLVYDVESTYRALTPTFAHVVFVVDVASSRSGEAVALMLAELDRLAAGVIDASDVDAGRRRVTEYAAEPDWMSGHLLEMAAALGAGLQASDLATELARAAAVDGIAVAELARHARSTAVMVAPDRVAPPSSWATANDVPEPEPVAGPAFETRDLRPSRRQRLALDARGLSLSTGGEAPQTIRWDDVVAATRELDGEYRLLTADGGEWTLDPSTFGRAQADVTRRLEQHTTPEQRFPAAGAEHVGAVRRVALRDIQRRRLIAPELRSLPPVLEPGERLERLAGAFDGRYPGLLAITDRRTIFMHRFGAGPQVEEVRHVVLPGVRAARDLVGRLLVLETPQQPRRYWLTERRARPADLRDLIVELRRARLEV